MKPGRNQLNLFAGETKSAIDDIPPGVLALFERFTFEVIRAGRKHYSSDAILHRIRWHAYVERRQDDFKCNDHWTAPLARWFMQQHPEHTGFFELRRLRGEDNE